YDYNLANAKHSLFEVQRRKPEFEYSISSLQLLQEAKTLYWRAYKACRVNSLFWPELLTNLANTLQDCFRLSEAISLYDQILAIDSDFAPAHINRGKSLRWLGMLSGGYSQNMLYQAFRHYDVAASSSSLPSDIRAISVSIKEQLADQLSELGF